MDHNNGPQPWTKTSFLRSMHNKEKLHRKYVNQKSFSINKVLHKIFITNRNIIKKTTTDAKTDYFNHNFIQGQNDMKRT